MSNQSFPEEIAERVRHLENTEFVQIGDGAPSHFAAEATIYWDYTNDALYVNNDGQNGWTLISGASPPGVPHAILSTTHTDATPDTVTRGALIAGQPDGSDTTWQHLALGEGNTVLMSDGLDCFWGILQSWNMEHNLLSTTHTDTTTDAVTRGSLVYGNAAPEWDELVLGAAYTHLESDGTDVAWQVNITLADDAWTGLGAAAGRLVYDSTPAPDEMRVVDANLDLNDNDLILDADGDSYLHAAGDNHAEFVLAGATGQLDVNINAADDFTFTANSLNVLSGSAVTMADDAWIGLGAALGRVIFDSTPVPDQVQLAAADLYLPSAHGVIHADGVVAGQYLRADGTRYVPNTIQLGDLPAHNLLSATHGDTVASVVARGDLIVGVAAGWDNLAHPGAAYRYLRANANDPGWVTNIALDDDAWIGLGAAAGRIIFNSTPAPDQVEIVDADLDIATSGRGIIHVDGVAAGQFLRANGTRYVPDTLDVADITDLAYGTPALTFSTANAAGAANTVMRTDATLAIFDAVVPTTIQCDAAAATGAAGVAARRDHTHGIVCSIPPANLSVSSANAEGTYTSFARADHSHAITSSSNPGAAAVILASAADGGLQLLRLGIGVDPDTDNAIKVTDNMWIGLGAAAGRISFDSTPAPDAIRIRAADLSIDTDRCIGLSTTGARIVFNDNVAVDDIQFQSTTVYINDTENTKVTQGLTINQGASDDEILALKSSDVSQPGTTYAEADTYGALSKAEGSSGGLAIQGFKDADGAAGYALWLAGRLGEAADTTKTTGGIGVVTIDVSITDGGTSYTTVGADGNLVVIRNHSTTRFIFDAEGSAHADIEWTTFDDYDDIALLQDFEAAMIAQQDPLKHDFVNFLQYNHTDLERAGIVHFDIDNPGHAMINFTRLSMLLVGAIQQLANRLPPI